ncbi:MAG: DUF2703 domain-containing protein [Candidatus Bipolaricaulia bacterium]
MPGKAAEVVVKLLHNKDCHIWEKALEVTTDVLEDEGLQYELIEDLIETEEEAISKGFSGSPQVKINGQDVDPDAGDITNYNVEGCRLYLYEGEVYEYPPRGMILDFLRKIRRKNEKG